MVGRRFIRVPLVPTRLSTGFSTLRAVVELLVQTQTGFRPVKFVIDPGAGLTMLPVRVARQYRIPIPLQSTELMVNTAAGRVRQRAYASFLGIRVPGLPGRNFQWPCHFVEGPAGSTQAGLAKNLLGLSGVVQDFRIIFDGTYSQESPHGWAILEELPASRHP